MLAQGGRCAICGHPILPHEVPVLDHVIPWSRGGEHSLENVQAAHWRCDNLKGDMTMDELRAAIQQGRLRLPEPPEEEPPSAMEGEYGLQ